MINTKYKNHLKNLENDGYTVIKNIFTEKEINLLRDIVKKHFKKGGIKSLISFTQPNAAVLMPELFWLFSHEKLIKYLNKIFKEKYVFTCHCDAHVGIISKWHKDDGTQGGKDQGYFEEWTYGIGDCKVYKVALYLQDHINNSAGLSVLKGSHLENPLQTRGKEIDLFTKKGDIVIFDVRLTHAGQKDIIPLRWNYRNIWIKNLIDNIINLRYVGKFLNQIIQLIYKFLFGKKMSIFFTYGLDNEWTEKFSKNNMKRQTKILGKKLYSIPKLTKQGLLRSNIRISNKF